MAKTKSEQEIIPPPPPPPPPIPLGGDETLDGEALVDHQELADALVQLDAVRASLREMVNFIADRGIVPRNDRQREMLERARTLAGEGLPPASDPV